MNHHMSLAMEQGCSDNSKKNSNNKEIAKVCEIQDDGCRHPEVHKYLLFLYPLPDIHQS